MLSETMIAQTAVYAQSWFIFPLTNKLSDNF
jgi:hypothetical protein